jgi:hypothetical protein
MQIDVEHACRDKVQYTTKRQAISAEINIENDNKARLRYGVGSYKNMGELNIYFCPFCGFWHVGHKTYKRSVNHG